MVLAAQVFIRYGRNFDVEIDAIEQGAADPAQVTLDDRTRAAAFARRVREESAGTCVCATEIGDSQKPALRLYVEYQLRSARVRVQIAIRLTKTSSLLGELPRPVVAGPSRVTRPG